MSRTVFKFKPVRSLALFLVTITTLSAGVWLSGVVSADESVEADTGEAEQSSITAQSAAPAGPTIEFATIEPQALRDWSSFSGRLAPVEAAAIKPLVSGTIVQVLFSEGQQVKRGDALFVIDPRPHQNALTQAEAAMTTAQSRAQLARDEFSRIEKLNGRDLASDSMLDNARSNAQVAEASVIQAESVLEQARLNLEYAHIEAPISGLISRAELTVGNVVETGGNAPVLTTIVANDRLYAEFNVDEQSYIQFARSQQHQQSMPVRLSLTKDEGFVYEGHLHAFDNHLDSSSGTIRARAIVENTDGVLTPGLYVTVSMGSALTREVLLVPERAIGTNQNRKFVYVVDDQAKAQYREVTLGASVEGNRVVIAGLETGDKVIVNGLSHVSPNAPVNAVPMATELVVSR